MKKSVGIFRNTEAAIAAVEKLLALGYTNEEISVISQDQAMQDYVETTELDTDSDHTLTGAVTGGMIGGLGALLLELGLIAIPGVGPFLAIGPVGAALVGALGGGAVGGMVGAFVDLGFEDEDAKRYAKHLQAGDILIVVEDHVDQRPELTHVLSPEPMVDLDRMSSEDLRSPEQILPESGYPEQIEHFHERWEVLKSEIPAHWDQLTPQDVQRINGDRTQLHQLLKERYGWDDTITEHKIDRFFFRPDDHEYDML